LKRLSVFDHFNGSIRSAAASARLYTFAIEKQFDEIFKHCSPKKFKNHNNIKLCHPPLGAGLK